LTLDLTQLESGVYFIQLQNAQNKMTHRVIKQ
jgi:hypothetical protein